ncbi:MAG: IS110 family transposase [Methylophilaceae bacterium]
MTDRVQSKAFASWIAIDIAKDFNVVMVETLDGKTRRFRMANSAMDHERLVELIRSLPQPCRIGFEATGNYHRTLAFRLASEGFDVCLISSLASARYREVMFNSWDKNDPKDAGILLELLKQRVVQTYVDPVLSGFHDIQELSKTYYHITLSRTRLQHSILTHYLPLYFPEMRKWWCSTRNSWWVNYLLHFPTPTSVTRYTEEGFCEIASPIVGRKVNKAAKLLELYSTAQHSIGLPIAEDSIACQTFRLQLQRYQELNTLRQQLEQQAELTLNGHPDYFVLKSVPGIGPIIALTILAEGGDLRRFGHHRQFLKYCGLDLAKNQSGAFRGQEKISKRGNARLRYALYIASVIAIRQPENAFRNKFHRYTEASPNDADLKRKAMTAVMAKMARVLHALIKSGTPYQGYFEALPSGSISLCRAVGAYRTP